MGRGFYNNFHFHNYVQQCSLYNSSTQKWIVKSFPLSSYTCGTVLYAIRVAFRFVACPFIIDLRSEKKKKMRAGKKKEKRLLCIIAASDGKASEGFSFSRTERRVARGGKDGGEDGEVGT